MAVHVNEEALRALTWHQAIASDDRTALALLLQQVFEAVLANVGHRSEDYSGTTDEERFRIWRRVVASLDAYVRLEAKR